MGYRTTRLFEQAFSLPTMTERGFADTLTTITAIRKNLLSRTQLGGANAPTAGADVENSVINYVKECTLTGVDLNRKSIDEILRDPDPLNAIRFDTAIYTTEIYIGGGAYPDVHRRLGSIGGLHRRPVRPAARRATCRRCRRIVSR